MKIMNSLELDRMAREYETAIYSGNYNEALRINQLVYESEYSKYRVLQRALEFTEKQETELIKKFGASAYFEEIERVKSAIRKLKKGLENLMETSIAMKNILLEGEK